MNDIGVETNFIKLAPLLKLARTIRRSKADIIHANYLKTPAYSAFLSFKRPYILHAHGDDIRYGLTALQKLTISFSAMNFYSTSDLKGIIRNSVHIPQPVDTSKFVPNLVRETEHKGALYFVLITSDNRLRWHEKEYIEQMKELCRMKGIELTLTPKVVNGIPYEQMPEYLSRFEYFFDREYPLSHSKTAIECMAMKIPVVSHDMKKDIDCFEKASSLAEERYTEILQQHSMKSVANLVKTQYLRVLNKS